MIKVWDKKNKEYIDYFIIEVGPFGTKVYRDVLDLEGGFNLEDVEIEVVEYETR